MSFFEDLMNNRDKQIMALSIVFFVLAFPIYFGLAAANADEGAGLNTINLYEIDGEYTYIELDAGDEFIPNGDPLMIDNLHTDAIDDAEDYNIIGVRMTMTYTEAEEGGEGPLCPGGSTAEDTITGMTMHGDYNETASGSNNGDSGSHIVESYWVNNTFFECRIKGNFKTKNIKSTNPIAVGDKVSFSLIDEGNRKIGTSEASDLTYSKSYSNSFAQGP